MDKRLSEMTEREINRAVSRWEDRLIDKMTEDEEEDEKESPCRGCKRNGSRCLGTDCPVV